MKLVLLGTGGYYANDRRHTACLMLPEVGVVLDAGSGMFRIRDYLATDRLDIFLTHAHLDHVIGLTYLIDVLSPEVLAADDRPRRSRKSLRQCGSICLRNRCFRCRRRFASSR